MATNQAGMTAEELLALGDIGRCELIQGELVRMSPAGFQHGVIAMRIGRILANHVERYGLGIALAAETGFRIARDPDTVRAPDAAFIANEHLPDPLPQRGFFPGPPDLAVEVVSPDDRWAELEAKAHGWIDAGCQLVWIVDPDAQTVTAFEPVRAARLLRPGDTLDGGSVLPGLQIAVASIFDELA